MCNGINHCYLSISAIGQIYKCKWYKTPEKEPESDPGFFFARRCNINTQDQTGFLKSIKVFLNDVGR
jgi:hypothetical protein